MVRWDDHPSRAERVAIALSSRSPFVAWDDRDTSHRKPPLPFMTRKGREAAGFCEPWKGRCNVCGQPVYPKGRFRGEKPGKGTWHAACYAAYKLWTNHRKALPYLKDCCAHCKRAGDVFQLQVDHVAPLYRVSRDYWVKPSSTR